MTYETIYIFTNLIYVFTISNFFKIFFDDKSCNKKLLYGLLPLYFIVVSVMIFITRIPVIMLATNVIFLFLISLSYKSSFQKKLMCISFIYVTGVIIELLSVAFFGYFEFSGIKDSTFNSIAVLIFIRVVTLIIVYIISQYKSSLSNNYNIPKIYYIAFFIILFGTLYLFMSQLSNDNITINHIIISGIILIVVNLTMIVIDEKIYKIIILENDKILLMNHNEALKSQMELINQSSEVVRLLKHDMKDHIMMLSNLFKKGNVDEIDIYIETLLGNIENSQFANSYNYVIDSIINFKLGSIDTTNINISINISVPTTLEIISYDLTVILSNLLDNAITACEKSIEKYLEIKISYNMGNLIILIKNSYNGDLILEDGKLKTTKLYNSNHGLGLISVRKIVEKYNGEINIDYTCNSFFVSIVLLD